jgi:Mg-chelatase subunit ChlD
LICVEHSRCAQAQTIAGTASVKVFVDASAKHGATAVPDISKLAASIDGKATQVLSVRPAKDDKLLFAVMVDISSSGRQQQRAVKDAVVRIFQMLTNEQSQGYLVMFNTQIYPSKRPLQPSEVQSILDHISFSGGTSLYDSVAQTASDILSRSKNADAPRRLILVLTDGKDNYSRITLDMMKKAVQQEGVAVFSLTQDSQDTPSRVLDVLLDDFTRDTGGKGIINEAIPDGVPALIAAVRGQVELTIASPQAGDGQLHSLSVQTSEKGIGISVPTRVLIP